MQKTDIQQSLTRLHSWQKQFKEKVLDDKRFKWFSRGVYGLTLVIAIAMFIQSTPYFEAIGQGDSAFKKGDYQSARLCFEKALKECEKFGPKDNLDWQSDPRTL